MSWQGASEMRFGKSAAEAADEPNRGGSGGDFIKYLKDGDTTFRLLQEPDDWCYYWEHFSPAGFSFPCPRAADEPIENCPGCSSDNEKMSKVSRKIAFNVLQGFSGQDYVNVYKVPNALADKLKNRFSRFGTITDRDYTITRYKTSGDRVDYDLEGNTPTKIDLSRYELRNIEQMLQESYDETWGNAAQAEANRMATSQSTREAEVATKVRGLTVTPKVVPQEPPSEPAEELEVSEDDLRAMDMADLQVLLKEQGVTDLPTHLETSDQIVDWLMSTQG